MSAPSAAGERSTRDKRARNPSRCRLSIWELRWESFAEPGRPLNWAMRSDWSRSALASFRSAVSKPSVNSRRLRRASCRGRRHRSGTFRFKSEGLAIIAGPGPSEAVPCLAYRNVPGSVRSRSLDAADAAALSFEHWLVAANRIAEHNKH